MKLKLDFKVRMSKVDLLSKSQWKWKLNIFMCKWKLSIFVCKIFQELRKTYVMLTISPTKNLWLEQVTTLKDKILTN